ncbi:Cd(II)/Pb(II)-responsive transcriptional regulator [Marinobacter sp. SS21]|uniref:Cd(II)/Pb(II)-responsive transcriptional regulator n=1 Tax=Marinobacter sp. SS21 TaxID=2979460 RepID=UPI00232B8D43|nr:Cd(II)/Pb(II)-responsive transcriptional regulator [Marinobacter sp. SS21]MDC0663664.1 Cd(II)/Pb(II)-responsive transcriptional regulator [Marinobacter sp. SS21]
MKIGQVSKQTGVAVETIRYYEKIDLLPAPEREASGYRHYSQDHLRRLLFIKRCRNLDMAQDEIRQLIGLMNQPEAGCQGVDQLLEHHLDHVRQRIAELQDLQQEMQALRAACASEGQVSECGILNTLKQNGKPQRTLNPDNHIPGSH